MKIFAGFIVLICGLAINCSAQFRLPPFEVGLKGGFAAILATSDITAINAQGEIHLPINQHISVGWIYARTVYGTNYDNTQDKDYNTRELITGPELRISAGRARKLRPYLTLSYTKFEIVTDFENYRNANKSNALGAHFGLMLKLGSRMYLNLLEAGVRKLSKEPFWMPDGNLQIEFKTGLSYNFGKKK